MSATKPFKATISPIKTTSRGIQLDLLREDLLGGEVQGNKYRKLYYNLKAAHKEAAKVLLTFGGAYSNHIAAVAAAAASEGFESLGFIRGEELAFKWQDNPTLVKAAAHGMKFKFLSRSDYKQRSDPAFIKELQKTYKGAYIIPEGGTNELAIKGAKDILGSHTSDYNYIAVPVGTGGTLAGLAEAASAHQKLIGFSALKGDFLTAEVKKWTSSSNWTINSDFSFGGYAKINQELIAFINQFNESTGIALDPVYTGKMIYGLFELLNTEEFPENSRILAVHTGGLQGIAGMKARIAQKGLPPLLI